MTNELPFTVATDREESEPCECGTPGCCVSHRQSPNYDHCETW